MFHPGRVRLSVRRRSCSRSQQRHWRSVVLSRRSSRILRMHEQRPPTSGTGLVGTRSRRRSLRDPVARAACFARKHVASDFQRTGPHCGRAVGLNERPFTRQRVAEVMAAEGVGPVDGKIRDLRIHQRPKSIDPGSAPSSARITFATRSGVMVLTSIVCVLTAS